MGNDFDCNMKNIKESISRAKDSGVIIRLGPELEITGYGCEDHFSEIDTVTHAYFMLNVCIALRRFSLLLRFSYLILKNQFLLGLSDFALCYGLYCTAGVFFEWLKYVMKASQHSLILMLLLLMNLASGKLQRDFVKMRLLKVATCSLNQWAMDFDCNMKIMKESVSRAKDSGAAIRLSPELEITGYGCEDHFLELDTVTLVAVAAEVCEEFFSPMSCHAELALNGVEVFMNANGSHHQLKGW
ncbi:hypothetical protein BUALT_Bualt12G0135900 [Buddleja alternifolia]|uniref:NAD(+) synthase [glutamine-hydrolyzing] n=1 Tax=Buddleja alternifolia TaxID=168488 RepID=A0AAV6WSP0_9LAMI|nr:hypothetical protein BUALT_Bualt12G0135900 [Buddleja alternifolia]